MGGNFDNKKQLENVLVRLVLFELNKSPLMVLKFLHDWKVEVKFVAVLALIKVTDGKEKQLINICDTLAEATLFMFIAGIVVNELHPENIFEKVADVADPMNKSVTSLRLLHPINILPKLVIWLDPEK